MAEKRKNSGRDMDDVDVSSRGNKVRPSDLVEIYTVPDKWARLRYHGPIFSYGLHWVKSKTKEGKPTKFPAVCTAFDSETGKRDQTLKCPWCEHEDNEQVQFGVEYWSNVLVRSLQKQKPSELSKPTKAEIKAGVKDKDSETWTPNRATRLTGGLLRALKELKPLNVHENAEGDSIPFSVSHIKYGCDVMVKYDKDAAQASRYSVQKGDPKPMSKEERTYLPYDISSLHTTPTLEEAQADYDSWLQRMSGKKKKKSSDEDDEDDTPKKKGKKVVDDDDDDDDDETPKKKTPPKKGKKVVDDDDDDEDDDDLDEDEDEPPKKKAPPKKGKKVVDEDEDEEDDEDEDDPPPKKKTPPKKGKKVVDDDDDEEDDEDEDDDDDDDDPPPKKKAPPKKGKKVVDEDDDDDDDPPPKKGKKVVDDDDEDDEPPPKKSSKKKKPIDDDDDE